MTSFWKLLKNTFQTFTKVNTTPDDFISDVCLNHCQFEVQRLILLKAQVSL